MERIEIDRTDEERADLVKEFIRDYWLTAALVIGGSIAAVGGINYYKSSKITARNESAQLAEKAFKLDDKADLAAAETAVKDLQDADPTSGYATLASLSLAKAQFEKGEFDKAVATYDSVINNHDFAEFRDVAKMRKARVQVAAKQSKQALETLKSVETDAHRGDATLLSGDIHLAAKEFDDALALYEKGLEKAENKRLFEQRVTLVKIKQAQESLAANPPAEQPKTEAQPATPAKTDTDADSTSETKPVVNSLVDVKSSEASNAASVQTENATSTTPSMTGEVSENTKPDQAQTPVNSVSETKSAVTPQPNEASNTVSAQAEAVNSVVAKAEEVKTASDTINEAKSGEEQVKKMVEQKVTDDNAAPSVLPIEGQAEEVTKP